VSTRSLAQAAASSAASSTVSPSATAAKPAAGKKPPEKHFIELYPLTSSEFTFGTDSCFSGTLSLAATNAAEVAKLLGSEPGFTLTAIPPNKIAVYYKSPTVPPDDLRKLKQNMTKLSSKFSNAIPIRVPDGSAEKSVAQLTLPPDGSIVVKAVGPNCILILSKNQSDPATVAALKKTIRRLYWQQPSTPPTQRLFYVDATAIAKRLSGSKDSSNDTSGAGKAAASTPKASSSSNGESATASSTVSPTVSVSVAPGGTPASSKATSGGNGGDSSDSSDQPDQSNADKTDSASKDTGGKPSGSDKTRSKAVATAAPKPPTMQPVNDMLVYSNDDGSDRGIFERNRLMAVLDLPRPEVLMNIWSLQASSGTPEIITAEAEAARELIAHHNDLLQRAIDRGWDSLSLKMREPGSFDELFYWYVTQKFGETDFELQRVSAQNNGGTPKKDESQLEKSVDSSRGRWGWCNKNQYCLGFSRAFEPLRPTFTNILIGIIAAKDPSNTAKATVDSMEHQPTLSAPDAGCEGQSSGRQHPCAHPDTVERFHSCIKDVDERLRTFRKQTLESCELDDRIAMSEQILAGQEESLKLNCFRQQTGQSFQAELLPPRHATTRVGLLRAAVADFLFNYKWATQYPHDFIPYDLTQSAQELNAEFNPLVLAFNRDVAAFTENLQAELQCKYEKDISRLESRNWFRRTRNWFNRGDRTFINDGMLSVRGISGVESLVDTVTQSFFDATNPPSLSDLVKSVSDAEKNVPGVLKTNLSANEAAVLLGALNSVQPAEAKVGRELKLDITPHALAGASSAELEVKLTAEEAGNPTRFTADKSTEDTLSRVAKHDVSTKVRVESTKLFEVSAFSAVLQRPRSKFPIVPPLFEVPYFGSFIGWPLSGAKVYHRSTAIVSAVIVPTAADLAFGIDFGADRFCDEDGCHRANSPNDFGTLPLRNFHKAMIECFASGGSAAYTGLRSGDRDLPAQATQACKTLTFQQVPPKE